MKTIQLASTVCIFLFLSACSQIHTENSVQPTVRSNEIAEANINLGMEYLKRGEYAKSLEKLKKAQEADPGYPSVYNAFGLLYQQLGEADKAEQNYKRALSLNASDPSTLNNYGFFLCQSGRYEEAEAAFLKAANNPLYKSPEIAISNAGTCALINGYTEAAETHFRNALNKNPRISTALYQMSKLSYNQGKYLNARGYLQRYLEIEKHTPKSLWLGIRIERELGDKDALSSYALLLRNNYPESEEAQLLRESGDN